MSEIEERVASSFANRVAAGVRVPYRNTPMTNKVSKLEVVVLNKGVHENAPAVRVGGDMFFDAEQLDAFIDTLKSAARNL